LGVESVYCWHALFGYWGGLHPFERGVSKFRPKVVLPRHTPGLLSVEPSQAWDPISVGGVGTSSPEALAEFYEELHAYLAACGVDGIKVDGQAMVGGLGRGQVSLF
jgi:raffinose synthase